MTLSKIFIVQNVGSYAEEKIRELVFKSGIDMSGEVEAYLVGLTSRSVGLGEWLEGDEDNAHAEYTLLFDLLQQAQDSYEKRLATSIRIGDIALLRLALFWDWVRERGLLRYYREVGSGAYLRAGLDYQAQLRADVPVLTDTVFHQLAHGFDDYAALLWDLFVTDIPDDTKIMRRFDRFYNSGTKYGRGILFAAGFI